MQTYNNYSNNMLIPVMSMMLNLYEFLRK